MLRVRKLSESGFIYGHYAGKTDLKLDSLNFSGVVHFRVVHGGIPRTGGSVFCPLTPDTTIGE